MAVTVDATSFGKGSTTPLTVAHTCAADATVLVVVVTVGTTGGRTISGVTYNGVAMTQRAAISSSGRTEIFTLNAPSSGANNISVTLSGDGPVALYAVSFKGSYTLGNTGTNSGTDTDATQTTATTGNSGYVVAGVNFNGGIAIAYTGSGNSIAVQLEAGENASGGAYESFTGSSNPTETWHRNSGSAGYSTAYVEISAVGSTGGFFNLMRS